MASQDRQGRRGLQHGPWRLLPRDPRPRQLRQRGPRAGRSRNIQAWSCQSRLPGLGLLTRHASPRLRQDQGSWKPVNTVDKVPRHHLLASWNRGLRDRSPTGRESRERSEARTPTLSAQLGELSRLDGLERGVPKVDKCPGNEMAGEDEGVNPPPSSSPCVLAAFLRGRLSARS